MLAKCETRPAWFPDWSGQTCALVASGPSARIEDIEKLRGRCRVMVINTTFQHAPWADALYAADGHWWRWHDGAKGFEGLRITQNDEAARGYRINRVQVVDEKDADRDRIITDRPGLIGRGDNGAFQAANILAQFGVSCIPLLGVDFCGERWHGTHPDGKRGQNPATLVKWATIFDAQAARFAEMGIEVVNLSSVSVLKNFPKMTVDAFVERLGHER